MNRSLLILTCFMLAALSVTGQTVDGLAMMKIEAGARPSGMGGAFTAIGGDAFSSAYNPAGSRAAERFTVSFGHIEYWENVRIETGYFSSPLTGKFSVHGGIKYASLGDIELRTSPTTVPDALADANDVSFKGGLGYRVTDRVYAGVSAGWFVEKIEGWRGSAFNFDVGVLAQASENLTLGASAMNLGGDFYLEKAGIVGSRDISLPATYRFGAAYQYKMVLGAVDAVILDDEFHLHVGAEGRLHELLAVRAGYMANYDSKNVTAGASFSHRNLAIEYAFVPYSNDLGTTHLFNFTIGL